MSWMISLETSQITIRKRQHRALYGSIFGCEYVIIHVVLHHSKDIVAISTFLKTQKNKHCYFLNERINLNMKQNDINGMQKLVAHKENSMESLVFCLS